MKINKHSMIKVIRKDWKEMILLFKSTKRREYKIYDQLVRDF